MSGSMSIVTWATSHQSTVGAGCSAKDVRTSALFGKFLTSPVMCSLFGQ